MSVLQITARAIFEFRFLRLSMPVNLNEIDFLCAEFKIKQIIFQLTLFSSQLLLRLVMTPISSLVHFRHFNLVAGRLDSSHK